MPTKLSQYFKLHRRYFRSINLERDLEDLEALNGYIITERSADILERILSSFTHKKSDHARTLTGVYGTGKSAFAHYLSCICSRKSSSIHKSAKKIVVNSLEPESLVIPAINNLPEKGILTTVATGRSEPLSWTLARALAEGAHRFWKNQKNPPAILRKFTDWEVEEGHLKIKDSEILDTLKELLKIAKTHVFIILDEFGKNLEYSAQHKGANDLYLLQQIAEMKPQGEYRVHFLGILHQSFTGYSDRLSATEQHEWNKIQGRFSDLPFQDSPSQMTRLIGQAIDHSDADKILCVVQNLAQEWIDALEDLFSEQGLPTQALAATYPIHPIVSLVLPMLCVRYAQNDRSLFTFLTSDEPYGLQEFLNNTVVNEDHLPTLKLHQVYDYFVESMTGLSSRFNLQRWVEIQGLIEDARDRAPDTLNVLKTIGILNLVTTTGILRATPELVALSMCDSPSLIEKEYWLEIISGLQKKGLITYRRQLNELRIWEGSDFNVEQAIHDRLQTQRPSLLELLEEVDSRKPLVIQRHYTTTGTLRYFEQRYLDGRSHLDQIRCLNMSHDGLIGYWVDREEPAQIPKLTADGKPLVIVRTSLLDLLHTRAQELEALQYIQKNAPELQNDGVARREVRTRLIDAERLLNETVIQAFDWVTSDNSCWIEGKLVAIGRPREFQSQLSDLCDRIYHQGIILDNELINRRVLTTQGAKARRLLLEAMLEAPEAPRLGLEGYGPEVSIYYSVLGATEIHRVEDGILGFYPPRQDSGVFSLWEAIESFCLKATTEQKNLEELYRSLSNPPYGLKEGVIPLILAAVLLNHSDNVGLYKDGAFIPVLGTEHFELLVKDPSRFSVKYFEIVGLRLAVFRDLEKMLKSPEAKEPVGVRNASLLMVAKPLFTFAKKLPKFTHQTQRISPEAQAVLKELQNAQEPDELLFTSLPKACGFEAIPATGVDDPKLVEAFRKRFVECLHEIQTAYEVLLADAQKGLYEAFGIRRSETKLREDLRVRANYLLNVCVEPLLKRFVLAAVDQNKSDHEWLEAVVMVVADKPPRSWSDRDVTGFELALSDVARRFKNLEALQKDRETQGLGFEAQRLTVTHADGREVNRVVWVEHDHEVLLDQLVEEVLGHELLHKNLQRQQAFLAKLSSRLLGSDALLGQNAVKSSRATASE